ncbi:tryptophan 2,3-dioxygenase [Stappia taiwanensis]|uniref:Tryptophan 2,3-dioxygenase n=1 Tax=Stappia taiwanensis TaxID=992267 RepID=A0A838Y0Y0_9HYPH|nr:tryptophan 2,3-dioxygenase [Stappia taiwanensis]MBA4612713.1 tryptophan 2,3-dioxygenase [Stappia taiwanensis]GGE90651.1 tryptophan 2,3-dioxygenase [Stappia taiwanensis]
MSGKGEAMEPFDPARDGAQMAFDGRMSYGDYLSLDKILDAQKPLSEAHDEMLFIIQHQTSELWMKLAIHELVAAKARIANDDLPPAFKMLTRVARIFEQLTGAWQVLRTMTPSEYTEFRDDLGQSSGFQSYQYRAIEFLAGNKNAAMLRPHQHVPETYQWLDGLRHETSIYDEALRLLARSGLAVDPAVLERDLAAPYQRDASVHAAWLAVYRDPGKYWALYDLAEKLVDFEDYFRRWRFNHVTTVERVIGFKRGTGGTSGVSYLRRMLDVVLFPELWDIRADL